MACCRQRNPVKATALKTACQRKYDAISRAEIPILPQLDHYWPKVPRTRPPDNHRPPNLHNRGSSCESFVISTVLSSTHTALVHRCSVHVAVITPPPVGRLNIAISVSVCLSVRDHCLRNGMSDLHEIFLPVTVARSSSGGVAIRCVLPVLWITSYFTHSGPVASSCAG